MSYNISSSDNILCPSCHLIAINTCKDDIDKYEYMEISCKNCQHRFLFVFCLHCNYKIYVCSNKIEENLCDLNARNISCPYIFCKKQFYITLCPNCQRPQKVSEFVEETKEICCPNCRLYYCQSRCPAKNCTDIKNFKHDEIKGNFPYLVRISHDKGSQTTFYYQKISCFFCKKPIVYETYKGNMQNYYEGQKIICPYSDCGRAFNRVVCDCGEEAIFIDAYFTMGSLLKCKKCEKVYTKVLCPKCFIVNPLHKSGIKSGKFICNVIKCGYESYIYNCLFCRRPNYFLKPNKPPIQGQMITCAYPDCRNKDDKKNIWSQVLCPCCRQANYYPFTEKAKDRLFSYGKLFKCIYLECGKTFIYYLCPKCKSYSNKTEDEKNKQEEGKKFICNECKIVAMNFWCPFCYCMIADQNSSLTLGHMVKCPSPYCGKKFTFLRCPTCKKLNFSKNPDEILFGKCVMCSYKNCGELFFTVECPFCNQKNICIGQSQDLSEGSKIKCRNCTNMVEFSLKKYKEEEPYYKNLSVVPSAEGQGFSFGIPKEDENYLDFQKRFYEGLEIYIKPSQIAARSMSSGLFSSANEASNNSGTTQGSSQGLVDNNVNSFDILPECTICHNNPKQSVFLPCGDRICCYVCAVLHHQVNGICPKCHQQIKGVLKKVVD